MWPLPPVGLMVQLAAVPFAATFVLGLVEVARPRTASLDPQARRLVAALAIGLPALLLLARARGAAHHYLAALPALFAAMVLGAARADASGRALLRRLPPLPWLVALQAASWLLFQSWVVVHHGSVAYGLPYSQVARACADVADAARRIGRGTPEAPLRLAVDVPRDRGPLPPQYRYLLEHRHGLAVRAPEGAERPDLVLRVTLAAPRLPLGRTPPGAWEILPGG
jgi:hypothetical protein